MNKGQPLVCVCIPTFNAAATIQETLESILAQTYSNLIIHIVDNASTDKTLEIAGAMADPRIHIHSNESNIGAEGNFTRCIQMAAGEYTAIFHADDLYGADMVAKQVAFLESHPDVGAVFTEAYMIDEENLKIGAIAFPAELKLQGNQLAFADIFRSILRYSNFFVCPSAMLRTRVYLDEIAVWRGELFGTGADLDVWLRVAEHHAVGILPERLVRYRISASQGTQTLRERIARGDFFRVIDHYLAKSAIGSMVTSHDLNNYYRLERTDKAVRATNLFLLERYEEARTLCREVLVPDALLAAAESRRGLITLLLAACIRVCIMFRLQTPSRFLLRRIRSSLKK
jgi:glycosyltransferase involved in cell wall biosynthesis